MRRGGYGRLLTTLVALAWLPGATAGQPVDPSAVVELPGPARALGSFLLVLLFGGLLRYRYGGFVDRSVDASMERPGVAVIYGLMAFGFVAFAGAYASSQLSQLPVGSVALATVAVTIAGLAVLLLAGLGFAVVGTLVTDVRGRRRPWHGLVLGAAISAAGWLLLPLLGGVLAWVLVASFGVGGPTREWFHSNRRAESDAND